MWVFVVVKVRRATSVGWSCLMLVEAVWNSAVAFSEQHLSKPKKKNAASDLTTCRLIEDETILYRTGARMFAPNLCATYPSSYQQKNSNGLHILVGLFISSFEAAGRVHGVGCRNWTFRPLKTLPFKLSNKFNSHADLGLQPWPWLTEKRVKVGKVNVWFGLKSRRRNTYQMQQIAKRETIKFIIIHSV